jgi:hypothetical protein
LKELLATVGHAAGGYRRGQLKLVKIRCRSEFIAR